MNLLTSLLVAVKAGAFVSPVSLVTYLLFNTLFTTFVIHFLYYRKSKRADYYFTYLLISASIFLIIFLLSGLKMKMGFALGLFAIFGIMKYRTVSMPVREMTYLFVLVSMSVINSMGTNHGWAVLICANLSLTIITFIAEKLLSRRKGVKYIKYDRIDLCKKSKREEMIADLTDRFELNITDVYIGRIDCLKDMALVKVYYIPDNNHEIDEEINKIPNE